MLTKDLNGTWRFIGTEPQSGKAQDIKKPCLGEGGWLPIAVPGDINDALVKNGKNPDPHYDTQARQLQWVTAKEWWYALSFDAPAGEKNVDLCLDRADGHTDIWLNDAYLGETKNAFRLFRFKVPLKEKDNVLLIRFKSVDQLLGGPRLDELAGWKGRRAFLRKPQYNFGWDWALPLPSLGLSGHVWLEWDNDCRLVDFSVQPFMSGRVDFDFEVSPAAKEKTYEIRLAVDGYGTDIQRTVSRNVYKSYASVMIPNPKLWYPNGYGEQPLYHYTVALVVDGQIKDKREGRIGLREVKIVEEPFTEEAGPGFSFWFEVNGIKVFCKGANWIPTEVWPGTAKLSDYDFYLQKTKDANFNMLRVWGGGVYENKRFYDLCDELGIMVWEDFMFASAGYPVDVLREEIIAEANDQIRRLRNHPCIVLWCGINEDVYSWSYHSDKKVSEQADTGVYNEVSKNPGESQWAVNSLKDDPQIYTMILRGLVSKFGKGVPYIESSPQSRDDAGNMPNSGNCHISSWKFSMFGTEGHHEQFRKHFNKFCSFDSEFCIQGPCSVKAFHKFMKPENYWPPNEAWIYHVQRGHFNIPHHEQTIAIAGAIFGKIDSLQKYVKYGQATHIEMMRGEYESARRDYPNNGGTMVWMMNDCWPTANWSIIDYYKSPKPAYYAAKRACAPLLPMIVERMGKIGFFFSNHTLKDVEVTLSYGEKTLEGKAVKSNEKKLLVGANSAIRIDTWDREAYQCPYGNYLFMEAKSDGKTLPPCIYFPDGWKDISWPQPKVKLQIIGQEEQGGKQRTHIRLSTDKFARLLHLLYEEDGHEVYFSDNYFDLEAGRSCDLWVDTNQKLGEKQLKTGHWLTDWQ